MDFLNPTFYDVADITDDMPNKALLTELYERMNEQNERLWMFFEEIDEDPECVAMKPAFIKPRQHRSTYGKQRNVRHKSPLSSLGRFGILGSNDKHPLDNPDSEEFEAGYKSFLQDEFANS